jgi:hypothetical protein
VNFLTLAGDEAEYRSKVVSALAHYRLEERAPVYAIGQSGGSLVSIAEELKRDNNPQHVRFGSFTLLKE